MTASILNQHRRYPFFFDDALTQAQPAQCGGMASPCRNPPPRSPRGASPGSPISGAAPSDREQHERFRTKPGRGGVSCARERLAACEARLKRKATGA